MHLWFTSKGADSVGRTEALSWALDVDYDLFICSIYHSGHISHIAAFWQCGCDKSHSSAVNKGRMGLRPVPSPSTFPDLSASLIRDLKQVSFPVKTVFLLLCMKHACCIMRSTFTALLICSSFYWMLVVFFFFTFPGRLWSWTPLIKLNNTWRETFNTLHLARSSSNLNVFGTKSLSSGSFFAEPWVYKWHSKENRFGDQTGKCWICTSFYGRWVSDLAFALWVVAWALEPQLHMGKRPGPKSCFFFSTCTLYSYTYILVLLNIEKNYIAIAIIL